MKLLDRGVLKSFAAKHRLAGPKLNNWELAVSKATWEKFADIRQTFRSADLVGPNVVFDVGSNRIVTTVNFVVQSVRIKRVLTHAEYERLDIAKL